MKLNIEKALRRAVLAQQKGRVQEAEKIYRSILKLHPKHGVANHNLGVLKVGFGKVDLAVLHFQTALEANTNQYQYWISYIDALIKSDQISAARKLLQRGRGMGLKGDAIDQLEQQLGPNSKSDSVPPERVSELLSLYQQGNLDKALVKGIELLDLFPNDPNVPNFLGAIKSSLGEHESAIHYYAKAIELSPRNVQAYNNLGNAFNELNRFEEAIVHYKKAVELKSDYAEAHYNLGVVLNEVERFAEAIVCYNKAIKLKPDYANAHNNLAMLNDLLGKFDLAIRHYSEAINLNPDHPEIHFNLARTLAKIKNFKNSIRHYLKAITLRPDFIDAYLELGMALHTKGSQQKASQLYRLTKLIRNENGIETVYLHHIDLSIDKKNRGRVKPMLDKNFGIDSSTGFIRATIPISEELSKVLCSFPTLSPEDEKEIAENKAASQIRKGGVQHSRGFNLFESSHQIIKQFEKSFINTVSEILGSELFIDDSFFAIYEGPSAAQAHHHLNQWDKEFNLHSVKYAAVYYVKVGDTDADQPGNLSLHDPDVLIKPKTNDLIIFPAKRMHSAYYNGLEKRIILGVNFYRI